VSPPACYRYNPRPRVARGCLLRLEARAPQAEWELAEFISNHLVKWTDRSWAKDPLQYLDVTVNI